MIGVSNVTAAVFDADRCGLEAYSSDCSSIQELEARERRWAPRGQYRNGFQSSVPELNNEDRANYIPHGALSATDGYVRGQTYHGVFVEVPRKGVILTNSRELRLIGGFNSVVRS